MGMLLFHMGRASPVLSTPSSPLAGRLKRTRTSKTGSLISSTTATGTLRHHGVSRSHRTRTVFSKSSTSTICPRVTRGAATGGGGGGGERGGEGERGWVGEERESAAQRRPRRDRGGGN